MGLTKVYTLPCQGETHYIRVSRKGRISLPDHDLRRELAIVGLGAVPAPCVDIYLRIVDRSYRPTTAIEAVPLNLWIVTQTARNKRSSRSFKKFDHHFTDISRRIVSSTVLAETRNFQYPSKDPPP